VPFKGSAAAMQALGAGEVQVAFDTVTSVMPQVRAGRVKALAITSKDRSAAAPDVPPLAESGVSGFDVATWFALFAPIGTPKAVIEKIGIDTVRNLQARDTVERLQGMGMTIVASTPEQLAAHVNSEIARWGKVVRESNIKVE
jgi:tripartite-type tricarboxylate transporter receptor subunit TctC